MATTTEEILNNGKSRGVGRMVPHTPHINGKPREGAAATSSNAAAPAVPTPQDMLTSARKAMTEVSAPAPAPKASDSTMAPPAKMSYAEMTDKWFQKREADLEAEAKREKRNRVFGAISDGISALSNIYGTYHGAKSVYDPSQSLSAKAKERYDKIMADRDANRRGWFESYMRARSMDEAAKQSEAAATRAAENDRYAKEQTERQWAYTTEKDKKQWQHQLEQWNYNKEQAEKQWQHQLEREKKEDDFKQQELNIAKEKASGNKGKATSPWSAIDSNGNKVDFQATSAPNAHSIAGANGWSIPTLVREVQTNKQVDIATGGSSTTRTERTSTGNVDTQTSGQAKPSSNADKLRGKKNSLGL